MDRLAKVRAAVAELVAADPGQWTLEELGQAVPDMAQIGNQLLAGQFRVLAAFDARGGAQIAGDRTTGEWLTGATKMSRHHAGGMVATARALRDDLPATAAVLAAGQVTGEQVRAIRRAQRAFGEDFAPIEAILAGAAVDMDIDTLKQTVDVAIQNYTPDGYDLSARGPAGETPVAPVVGPGRLVAPDRDAGRRNRGGAGGRVRRVRRHDRRR